MNKDEALRLALKTLEYAGPSWIEARQPAITAIKAALEAKDEPVAWNVGIPSLYPKMKEGETISVEYVELTPPQRKPLTIEQPKVRTGDCLLVGVCASEGHKIQPQRTWVGLTDEEKNSFWKADQMTQKEWDELFSDIEAKLKEKNT